MTTATHERVVWLVTITSKESAKPTAVGIFDDAGKMSESLTKLGLARSDESSLRNPDGTIAAYIFDGPKCTATIAMMTRDVAEAVANLEDPMWDVPDAPEEE